MPRTEQPRHAARRENGRWAHHVSQRVANVRGFVLFVILLLSIWAILRLILAPHVPYSKVGTSDESQARGGLYSLTVTR